MRKIVKKKPPLGVWVKISPETIQRSANNNLEKMWK